MSLLKGDPMTAKCQGCRDGAGFETPFSMAFQPIVDLSTGSVFGYEALVRGTEGQGADTVLSALTDLNRYAFDQACRVKAIEMAAELGLRETGAMLSINFMPNAVYEPLACIQLTLATARATGFPTEQLIFEFTENERLDHDHVGRILTTYKAMGFKTAIDDFGAGFAGLTLLAKWQPDIIKLDMELVRGIDRDRVRRALVRSIALACAELEITVLGEGVETEGEAETLRELDVTLHQGYLYGRPAFEALPEPSLPLRETAKAVA
jgi:EAL domain-containing protein (putative c-di-GMP-specific phosphodiesterase class I)